MYLHLSCHDMLCEFATDTMVIYALSRRRRDAAFSAAASGPAAPDAPPCHVDPTAPFLGRAAHGSVAAAVAAVRGASGAEAAVLRVAAFRQRPSLSPTLLLPAAVEEAPAAGGAAMAGPPDAAVTAVYAVPNRAEVDMAEGSGGLTADTAKWADNTSITVTLRPMVGEIATMTVRARTPIGDMMELFVELSDLHVDDMRFVFVGKALEKHRTLDDYGIQDGSTIHVVWRVQRG